MALRNLGFMTPKEAKAWARKNNCSWMSFQGNFVPEYTLWQRLRLAILLLLGRNMNELAPQFKRGRGPTIDKVQKWIDKAHRDPAIQKALEAAADAFGDEEGEERHEDVHLPKEDSH